MKIAFQATRLDDGASYSNLYKGTNQETFRFSSDRDDSGEEIKVNKSDFNFYQIVFDDQQTWIGPIDELEEVFAEYNAENDDDVIQIPKHIPISNTRGKGAFLSIKLLSVFDSDIPNMLLTEAVKRIEKCLAPKEGLFIIDSDFEMQDFNVAQLKGSSKYLLMLHGTASSCKWSFDKLNVESICDKNELDLSTKDKESVAWSKILAHYNNRVIGFEHHTISKDIFQNVIDLLEFLPDEIDLDIISHSRGGLIGELLVRFATDPTLPNFDCFSLSEEQERRIEKICTIIKGKKIRIDKFIRVACPAAGTALLSDRLSLVVNIFVNLLLEATGTKVIKEVGNAILTFLDSGEEVLKLPGLQAMVPSSNFQLFINDISTIVDSDLHVVESVANKKGKWWKGIAFFMMKFFMYKEKNDFVVDTRSMTKGFNRNNPIKLLTINQNNEIHHFNYFCNTDVQCNILQVLQNKESKFEDQTSSLDKSVSRSSIKDISIADEQYKGDVLFIPSIFGSSIQSKGREIWPCLDDNQLLDLKAFLTTENIETNIIGEYYVELHQFLNDQGYRVLKFAYDWRKSSSELIVDLQQFISSIDTANIKTVISYYTGANIAFELWKKEKENSLFLDKNVRYLLLGPSFSGYEKFQSKDFDQNEIHLIFKRIFGHSLDVEKDIFNKLDSFKELKKAKIKADSDFETFRKRSLKVYGYDFQEDYEEGTYFTDLSTGELTVESSLFAGYRDLIRMGETQNPNLNRVTDTMVYHNTISHARSSSPILGNNKRVHLSSLLKFRETKKLKKKYPSLNVTVTCGHLAKALYPVMVGHTSEDNLRGAEYAVNSLLDNRLADMIKLGVYPMVAGETKYIPSKSSTDNFKGGIVLCFGNGYDITGYKLERYVQKAALNFALNKDVQSQNVNGIGISTVLIGSLYGRLSTLTCLEHTIKGIYNANELLLNSTIDIKITNLEFIEIYEDRHIDILVKLRLLQSQLDETIPFTFDKKVITKAGARIRLPNNHNKDWYNRYEITKPYKEENVLKYVSNTTNSVREIVKEKYDETLLKSLLEESRKSVWDKTLSKTLFELLIPNDFKLQFARQANIVLALDIETANFPWEMISAELSTNYPISTKAWMIRQLNTTKIVQTNYISSNTAFIVGNPNTENKYLPLRFAEKEAKNLNNLLLKEGFTTSYFDSKDSNPIEIIKHLLAKEYKILHFAAHGIINENDPSDSKIVIGPDNYIDINTIKKMSYTPEFAFINCCYLGTLSDEEEQIKEEQKKLDYPLFASNLGTQLLTAGYKAIIVAGWKLDDLAAKTFSSVFYTYFLNGYTFAQSVLFARKTCFNAHSSSNTWGAYQCYGNPDYTLVQESTNVHVKSEEYIVPEEFIILIRNFMNDVIANDFYDKNDAKVKLDKIAKNIKQSKFRNNAKIIEELAKAYMEILATEKSIELFEKLFKLKSSRFHFRSLEQYYLLRIRSAMNKTSKSDKKQLKQCVSDIQTEIDKLEKLIDSCPPSNSRNNILGSAQQRLTSIEFNARRNDKVVSFYKDALGNEVSSFKESHYELIMYFKANYLQTDKLDNSYKVKGESGLELLKTLEQELIKLKNSDNFWDEMALVSYYQLRLILSEDKNQIDYYSKESIRIYKKVWLQLGGTFRNKEIEREHCGYLIQGLEFQSRKRKSRIDKKLNRLKIKAIRTFKIELNKI